VPDENLVLQGPIKEDVTLKKQLRLSLRAGTPEEMARLRALLGKTARGLAELHGSGVTSGKVVTFEDELTEVRGRIERLERFVPEIVGAADPLFDRLEDIARAHPADPAVPSHRSFRPAQVLIAGDDIGFIDFDSFCQAEPALDLSLFLSVLRDLSLRALQGRDGRPGPGEPARAGHLSLVDDLSAAFLDAYEAATPVSVTRVRVDLWHGLEVGGRIANFWIKDRPERLSHCMQLLTHLYAREGLTELVA
jgi:aminoglycoside phosphotransferase (APT) family kinase protein